MVQWFRLHASSVGDMGSIPCQGTKIPHAVQCGQKKKKKKILALTSFLSGLQIYLFIIILHKREKNNVVYPPL